VPALSHHPSEAILLYLIMFLKNYAALGLICQANHRNNIRKWTFFLII
jgi:hypothetical protein